ncbi:MAG: hypothetical protein E7552_00765 [Ruminococcaceae bacterium]|nr:hypothetical protein [Oscillospiraceae bacterium]
MRLHPLWKRLYGVVLLLAVVSGVVVALSRPAAPADTDENAPVGNGAEPFAVVGTWDGQLAVFSSQGDTPTAVYDVFITSLPVTEQEALRAGIPVYSAAALQRLLEDYTG